MGVEQGWSQKYFGGWSEPKYIYIYSPSIYARACKIKADKS
jgi:hypothetical protein